MKKIILSILTFCSFTFSFAQVQGDGGVPKSYKLKGLTNNATVQFQEPNVEALRLEDEIVDASKSGPWRFGYNNETELTLLNSGSWTTLPNGAKIWRLKMVCENALTVNLTLSNVKLPEGNELYFYNLDKSFILGKFTAYHLYEGELGSELIPGNTVIAEYYVAPNNLTSNASLQIDRVTHGYRTANEFAAKAFGSSGGCNMNVNCPDGMPWADQKRGAVMLVSGSNGFCSGSLINNTQNDGKPYVLTANHCYSAGVTSWIFRFKWESATCTNPGTTPAFVSLSGAVLRARRTPSDFCLVEITGGLVGGLIPASYNAFFPGWNNASTPPTNTVSIHHPSGDITKISFDDNPASLVQAMGSTEALSSWAVSWDRNTTTEGGSSGSPLFNQNGQIIGQLWGGGASCSNLSSPDYYGAVNKSWEPAGSTSADQLKFWLDPNLTGVSDIGPYDPANPPAANNAGINSISSPTGNYCGSGTFTPTFVIRNYGNNNLTSATITYSFDGGASQVYNWTGNLAPNSNSTVTLPSQTLGNGAHTFSATSSLPNGNPDSGTSNDTGTSSFTINLTGQIVTLTIETDCYGNESSWILNDANSVPVASSTGGLASQATLVTDFCLSEACYSFVMNDSYGDGMQGGNCATIGNYAITNSSNTVLASLQQANFGFSETNPFCVGVQAPCSTPLNATLGTVTAANGGSNGAINVSTSGGSGVGTYTYSWTGAGGYANTVEDISSLAPGLYTLLVSDTCGNTTSLNNVQIVDFAGVEEQELGGFSIYPNPNSGSFSLLLTNAVGEYTVAVRDLSGRVIYEQSNNALELKLDLPSVAKGNYFVTITGQGFATTRKIQIQK